MRLAAKLVARALRAVARLLDPAGVDSLEVHVNGASRSEVDQLVELVRAVVNERRGTRWAR